MAGTIAGASDDDWFSRTHWSVVWKAKDALSPEAAAALDELCNGYWRPVFTYIRSRGYSREDAEDLTQDFFSALLSGELLKHLKHQDGRFRSFLMTLIDHRLSDHRDKTQAKKRGGGKIQIALDAMEDEERANLVAAPGLTPAELFDRSWAKTVLRRTQEMLARMYEAEDKKELFLAIRDLQPNARTEEGYEAIATRLGITVSALKAAVHRMRGRWRELLRKEVAGTVGHPGDLNDEIAHLMRMMSA